jgi:pimeloyl-ACP methyl ester carboxylesterase
MRTWLGILAHKHKKLVIASWAVCTALLVVLLLPTVVDNIAGDKSPDSFYVRSNQDTGVIIFVHGVMGDSIDTWTNSRTKAYWPTLLLKDHVFNGYDVYAYGFPSPLGGRSYSVDELADNMRLILNQADVLSQKELIFLSHSMGGLITRAFLLKHRSFLPKTHLLLFYSTPTTGSQLASIAHLVSDNPQFKDMFPMGYDSYIEYLQSSWLAEPKTKSIRSYCAYEKLPTNGLEVVMRQSATNLCTESLNPILADHISIVKPADATSLPYLAFREAFVETHKQQMPTE